MFPEWTWVVGFWIGAAVGSFLNVVIYRLPRGMSINEPKHSFCTVCKKRLGWLELIPLLSWLLQRGRCKCGESRVAPRYFIVELINGTLWAVIWYQHLYVTADPLKAYSLADPVMAIGYMLFASALVAAIFTDIAHYIIPDQINAFMLVVGVGMNIAYAVQKNPVAMMWGMPSSIAGALVGIGVLWGIAFLGRIAFRKDAMGHGDIKMARGIGAVLLPLSAGISFGLAVFLGAVGGIGIMIARVIMSKRAADQKGPGDEAEPDEEPYVPESLGSLLWCGLGYLLCIDVIGLFIPKFYEWWFAENPYAYEDVEDDPQVELTMIPFGPYLAAGALGAMLFAAPLNAAVLDYWRTTIGK